VLSNRVQDLEGENEHLREQLAAADSIWYPEGAADVCFCLFRLAVDDVVDAMLTYDAPNAVKIANGILAKYATFPRRDAVTSASTPRSVAETLKLFRPMQAEGISVCCMPALGRAVPG
jgi:hypothetical protein